MQQAVAKHGFKLASDLRVGFRQNGFFADFYFWAAGIFGGFCRRILFSFLWKNFKVPKKSSRKSPAKSSKIYTTKIPDTFLQRAQANRLGPASRGTFAELLLLAMGCGEVSHKAEDKNSPRQDLPPPLGRPKFRPQSQTMVRVSLTSSPLSGPILQDIAILSLRYPISRDTLKGRFAAPPTGAIPPAFNW